MRRLAVVTALASLAILIPQASAAPSSYVRVYAYTLGIHRIDEGRAGISTGDLYIYSLSLRDRHGRRIGTGTLLCQITRLRPRVSLCTGVYTMPLGKLVAVGTRHVSSYYILPITGGTGLYESTSGTLVGNLLAPRTTRLLFSLTTP